MQVVDKPMSVEEYLAALPKDARATLEKIRQAIMAAAPTATEKIGYGMPGFSYEGRYLVYYAGFKNHCSFFPASTGVMEEFSNDLESYDVAKEPSDSRSASRCPGRSSRSWSRRGSGRSTHSDVLEGWRTSAASAYRVVMATYEHLCLACEHPFEERRPMTSARSTALACPSCGSDRVRRRFSFSASTGSAGATPTAQPASGGCCGGACGCSN